MGLFYKTGINGLKPKKLTDFILKKLYTRIHSHNSICHNISGVRCAKLNKTSKPVSCPVSTWLTAFHSQQLPVILTAVGCEFKKQLQFSVKETDC